MVVAGAKVRVAAQLAALHAGDEQRLAVRLVHRQAEDHVHARAAQAPPLRQVVVLVEAGAGLKQYRYLLARLRSLAQRTHDWAVAAHAV
ncbi:hypothetical protein SDC9_210339 [bioreactor metagenome]|uniref:Uncharacterized protein n=1 Tax=bioreactor metagenome TaxID=1076179 RepID=A0A645JFW0_9ZZZZ